MANSITQKISLKAESQAVETIIPKRRNYLFIVGTALLVIIVIVALSIASYFYSQYQNVVNDPKTFASESTRTLISELSKIIELPNDEEPTIATVNDKTKLADQPFFVKSQNGDKVFIYAKNKKAILFRPSANKIIEVANISIDNLETQETN